MPNASDGMTSGGGALAYPTGKEVLVAMTGATSLTAAAHGNKALRLVSNNPRHHLKLMDATTLAASKRGFGVLVGGNSAPIPVFNAGVLGTDPVFEGWLMPGATGQFYTTDLASAKGNWHFDGTGFNKVFIPLGGIEADQSGAFDLGGTAEFGTQGNDGSVGKLVMLTGTLGVAIYNGNDTNDDIFALPFKLNVSGDTLASISWAAAQTTVFTHATDVYLYAAGLRLSATQCLVYAVNTTTTPARLEYRVLTVDTTPAVTASGAIVTDGAATHGIVGSNFESFHVCKDGGDADGSTAFWVRGPRATGGTNTQVVHYYTVSGTTITRAAEYNDAAINDTSNGAYGIYSATAGAAFAPHLAVSTGNGTVIAIKKLKHAAGVISVTWTTTAPTPYAGSAPQINVQYVEPIGGVAYLLGLNTTFASHHDRRVYRIAFNPATGAFRGQQCPRVSHDGVSASTTYRYGQCYCAVMVDTNGGPEVISPYYSYNASLERRVGGNAENSALGGATDQYVIDSWAPERSLNLTSGFLGTGPWNYGFHASTRAIVGLGPVPDVSGGNQKLRVRAAILPRSLM